MIGNNTVSLKSFFSSTAHQESDVSNLATQLTVKYPYQVTTRQDLLQPIRVIKASG